MSWSVQSIGKPAAVKAALVKQFANSKDSTKNIPEEQACVMAAEGIVNAALDYLATIPGMAVNVVGNGSAYRNGDPPTGGNFQFKLEVAPIYGFAEDVPPKVEDNQVQSQS